MHNVILAMLAWIGINSNYNTDLHTPNIVMTELHNMCAQYGINNKKRCQDSRLQGFFNKHQTIYLKLDFEQKDLDDQSKLVHELVHYVQWKNGRHKSTCLGHLELEAYVMQDQWRVQHGLEPKLDEFNKMMLQASCD